MSFSDFPVGARVLTEGLPGDEAYLVVEGRIEVYRDLPAGRRVLGHVGPGGILGEMALVDDGPRMASAVAVEPTRCRRVGRATFAASFHQAPPLIRYLLQTQVNSIRNMAGAPFSYANTLAMGGQAASSHTDMPLERRIFGAGQTILTQGEAGDAAYLVRNGLVELRRKVGGGPERKIRRLGPGCVFGEAALLEKLPRSATAVAVEPAVCEIIDAETFERLVASAPPVIRTLLHAYLRHIQDLERAGD